MESFAELVGWPRFPLIWFPSATLRMNSRLTMSGEIAAQQSYDVIDELP